VMVWAIVCTYVPMFVTVDMCGDDATDIVYGLFAL
jgi:hypothetical protein